MSSSSSQAGFSPNTSQTTKGLVRMHVGGHRSIPLVDADHRPVGIVTVKDVVKWLAKIFPEAVLNLRPGDKLKRPLQADPG